MQQQSTNSSSVRAGRVLWALPDTASAHCIGGDSAMVDQIYALIDSGDKCGTFASRWLVEHAGKSAPKVGDVLVLVSFEGTPQLVVRLTDVEEVRFGDINESHTAIRWPRYS